MTVDELVEALESDYHIGSDPVVAIDENGTTYSIREVVEERHELGTTIWLRVEEN